MLNAKNKNLLITIGFLLLFTEISLIFSLNLTQGNFTYSLDDPYIHLSIAKHFIEQGIWSVDGYTYASASSSPLWDIVLSAFYFLLGTKFFVYVPFALNILFQILSLIVVFDIVKKITQKDLHYLFGIIIVLSTPFIILTFGGMEHSLQIYLVLLFIEYLISYMQHPNSIKNQVKLLILSPFVVFVRYEDIALISVTSLVILFYFRNWKLFISLILSSLILVILFGLWTKIVFNLGFLPSSIIAKSIIGSKVSFVSKIILVIKNFARQLLQPNIIVLYILNLLILINIKSFLLNKKELALLSVIFIGTLFIHAAFVKYDGRYRYDAYLVLFGVLNVLICFYSCYEIKMKRAAVIACFVSLVFGNQMILAPYISIFGTNNIYEQQIQMANFLHQQCDTCNIAANDIGAITYLTNIHLLDMYGLGSYEVLMHKKNGTYTNEVKNNLLKSKDVSLIIVYDNWFKHTTFDNYTKIAEWKIQHNIVCAEDTVSFYSRNDKVDKNFLKIKKYSKYKLPKDVIVNLMEIKI